MIAPRKRVQPETPPLPERAAEFFRAGGVLERACAGGEFVFEARPQQAAMAAAVAETLLAPAHLAVEAGTGVGKTFAYLVPLIMFAVEQEIRVAVSTCTINLQEQLVFKDIPFLKKHLGIDFEVALCKGRGNYLCLRRLERSRQMGSDLFNKAQEREIEKIRRWADGTADGSLADFSMPVPAGAAADRSTMAPPPPDVWSQVCSEHDNCLARQCKHYARCFVMRARARAFDADLLILNHHLFFSDLGLRAEGGGLLPAFERLVLDEAHRLEDTASEHLGVRLSQGAFEHWLRRLYVPEHNKGILAALKQGAAAHEVAQLWDDVERFFLEVKVWSRLEGRETRRAVPEPLEFAATPRERLMMVVHHLNRLAAACADADIMAELEALARRGMELHATLDAFLKQTLADQVYWVEREGARRRFALYSAPIEIGPLLVATLFKPMPSVVMTSATISVEGRLDYFKRRVGAETSRELIVGSPFNYSRQMRVFIAADLPDPGESEAFTAAAARGVEHFVRRTGGRAFALFTSAEMMRAVARLLHDFFEREKLLLLMQGEGLTRHAMLRRFVAGEPAVLFGLDSFWMGVDVRGEALSNVIIVRLPFAVPDEPLIKARMDRIEARGGDPFREYTLPEAILKFRQGVGRLIRSTTDEGIIAILDSRILKRWYGRLFLKAIPECPVEMVAIGTAAGDMAVDPESA